MPSRPTLRHRRSATDAPIGGAASSERSCTASPVDRYGALDVPRPLLFLLLACCGAIALVAMHGVAPHGALHHSAGAVQAAPDVPSQDDGHSHGDDEHHDSGGTPCGSCGHGNDDRCASIVTGGAPVPQPALCGPKVRALAAPPTPLVPWPPDPPVPRLARLLASL